VCNEVRELIVEGHRAFVLIFDWRRWPEVLHELQARTGAAPPPQPANA
jgi:hypothetical protein